MKKITLVLLFVSISVLSFSQEFRFGMQITGTSSWLMNKQMFDEGPAQDPVATSFGEYFGPSVTFKPIDILGIELGLNFNMINQKYKGDIKIFNPFSTDQEYNHYNATLKYKSLDIPIMVTLGKKIYFEFGGVLHFKRNVRYTRTFDNTDVYQVGIYEYNVTLPNSNTTMSMQNPFSFNAYENELIDDNDKVFKKFGFGLAIGVGADIDLGSNFILNVGLRANYILTDMQGVNGLLLPKDYYSKNSKDYTNFKTNPLYGGIRIGLRYRLEL